jgi:predicted DNA-binding transcriptional regulator AlpA
MQSKPHIDDVAAPIYLRERDVVARYRVGRSWFRELVADGVLPQPRRLGSRCSLWSCAELDAAFAADDFPDRVAARNHARRNQKKARTKTSVGASNKKLRARGAIA